MKAREIREHSFTTDEILKELCAQLADANQILRTAVVVYSTNAVAQAEDPANTAKLMKEGLRAVIEHGKKDEDEEEEEENQGATTFGSLA